MSSSSLPSTALAPLPTSPRKCLVKPPPAQMQTEILRRQASNDQLVQEHHQSSPPPGKLTLSKRHTGREAPLISPSLIRAAQASFVFPSPPTVSSPLPPFSTPRRNGGEQYQLMPESIKSVDSQSGEDSSNSLPSSLSPSATTSPSLSTTSLSSSLRSGRPSAAASVAENPRSPLMHELSSGASYMTPQESSSSLATTTAPAPVFPFPRPYSVPDSNSGSFDHTPSGHRRIHSPTPVNATLSDRTSSASLPPPMQTPYFALPKVAPESTSPPNDSQEQRGPPTHGFTLGSGSTPEGAARLDPKAPIMDCHGNFHAPSIGGSPSSSMSSSSEPSRTGMFFASSTSSYPPPAPPTILTPPPHSHAPYEPFLSHAPPPVGTWIAIETAPAEYKLIVRLPGFSRDAITLATRRRRILHIVADSWEQGGGHFERRISFGYDADLSQVRAEYDGELLKVFIPRRTPHTATWNSS